MTSPDPDAVAKEACKDGAVQIGETVEMFDGEKALYLRDPWGCIVEVLTCSLEQLMVGATLLSIETPFNDSCFRQIENSPFHLSYAAKILLKYSLVNVFNSG